ILISPLAAASGRLLATLGGGQALGTFARLLQGGVIDAPLAAVSLALIGHQWSLFNASGKDTGSHEYKSLVANTVITVLAVANSLITSGLQVATLLSGALAGAASVAGAVALPVALLTMLAAGAVNTFLWVDAYGDCVRGASEGDRWAGVFAKFFGINTEVFARAEIEKTARDAAAARAEALHADWSRLIEHLSDVYAKLGYRVIEYRDQRHEVSAATFKIERQESPFTFVLQDRLIPGFDTRKSSRFGDRIRDAIATIAPRAGLPVGVGGMDRLLPQYIEVEGSAHPFATGGQGDDTFRMNHQSRVSLLEGGAGSNRLVLDATLQHVEVHADTATPTQAHLVVAGRETTLRDIRHLEVRASSADIRGGTADEVFDISADRARIEGGGGRNTFVLRAGNQVVTGSDDLLMWDAVTPATVTIEGGSDLSLALMVRTVHESLSLAREGPDLVIHGPGPAPLTMRGFFSIDAGAAGPPRARRRLLIRDASGVDVIPAALANLAARITRLAMMPKTVIHGVDTPAQRRHLTGDAATTLFRLPAGGGSFTVDAGSSGLVQIYLDTAWQDLRHRIVDGDLMLQEQSAITALTTAHAPLTLVIPDYVAAGMPLNLVLMARSDPAAPDAAPVRLAAPPATPGAPGRVAPLTQAPQRPIAWPAPQAPPHPAVDPESGIRIHDLTASTGEVHVDSPGTDLVVTPSRDPHDDAPRSKARTTVWLGSSLSDYTATMDGLDLTLSLDREDGSSTVHVLDYYREPLSIAFGWQDARQGDVIEQKVVFPPGVHGALKQRYRAPSSMWRALDVAGVTDDRLVDRLVLLRDFVDRGPAALRLGCEATDGAAYLRLQGVDPAIADAVGPESTVQIIRVLHLLAIAGAPLPAALLRAYARATTSPPILKTATHRALLLALAEADPTAALAMAALRLGLSLSEWQVFDGWRTGDRPSVPGDPAALQALGTFARLIRRAGQPDTALAAQDLSLMRAILVAEGRSAVAATRIAQAMVDAGTLDDDWVARMLHAGVPGGAEMGRLRLAGVSPEDVLAGEMARKAYEGLGDRSALIAVSTGAALQRMSPSEVRRYIAREYLALDGPGHHFVRLGAKRPGVPFDIEPGDVLDATGQAPALETVPRLLPPRILESGRGAHGWTHKTDINGRQATRNAVAQLAWQGLVDHVVEPVAAQPRWHQRSAPQHLVDGFLDASDAFSWTPALQSDRTDFHALSLATGRDATLEFTLSHKIRLTRLRLHVEWARNFPWLRQSTIGHWRMQARNAGQAWRDVSGELRSGLPAADLALELGRATLDIEIDTAGLPFQHYRLVATGGDYSAACAILEASVVTAPVATPRSAWPARAGQMAQAMASFPETAPSGIDLPTLPPADTMAMRAAAFPQSDIGARTGPASFAQHGGA
ncbi:MAG: hypothetical protein ABW220_06095, partial [Burkholderiaceae bacterium]